jgi:hypothetical protein
MLGVDTKEEEGSVGGSSAAFIVGIYEYLLYKK